MDNIVDVLIKEMKYYDNIVEKSKKSLNELSIDGGLRVAFCKGNPQYYLITEKGDTNGKYISKENINIAKKLAQRDYERKVHSCAMQWSKTIKTFLDNIPQEEIKDIYKDSPGRRKMINSYELGDEEYLDWWLNVEYKGKGFEKDSPEIYTEKGERVRSKSEKIIADKLYLMGIPYRYEYPITLKGYGTIYPDFTLLDIRERREIILEHFGMMDNPEYCNKAIDKINRYALNGIFIGDKLLITFETSYKPLSTKILTDMVEQFI